MADVQDAGDLSSPAARRALENLRKSGEAAIQPIVDALAVTDKAETDALVAVLRDLTNEKTFPRMAKALVDSNARAAAAVTRALALSRGYSPQQVLDLLDDNSVPRPVALSLVEANKARIPFRDLINATYRRPAAEKTELFKVIGEIASDDNLEELLLRVEGQDPIARMNIISILSKFNRPQVRFALQQTLKDDNKRMRAAALKAIASMQGAIDPAQIAPMLRDLDMEVQNLAIEILTKAAHPDTVTHLVDILKDESEYSRRAAVEVLNVIGDERMVRTLLEAIKDDDWWVRGRAADALGKIGGPNVINAALSLVSSKDEEVRRTAVEILNQTNDERAAEKLIEASRDADWWVSERAVDALGAMGTRTAIPRLLEMLEQNPKSVATVVRALGKIGDSRAVEPILSLLGRKEVDVLIEAANAIGKLCDEKHYDDMREQLKPLLQSREKSVIDAAFKAVAELDTRFAPFDAETILKTGIAGMLDQPAAGVTKVKTDGNIGQTMLIESADVAAIMKAAETHGKLDISTLNSGDIVEGRYKFIQRIGKGAFGTVLLFEDAVVGEKLILKFLNPTVSQDEEMMQRFVHELRYSRKITHPNVIRIYDFLQIRGNYAISMEYFPSHTLTSELTGGKPMGIKRALRFAIDVTRGMTVAHNEGIVHRDLKPANVLIIDDGLLKIVDFGVAAAHQEGDTQLTKTGYVIGSPKYMAPEQILGKKVDIRADVYSLGVILYELLTGSPPYHRGDHMAVMYQHVQGRAVPPIEANPELSQGLSDAVMKAMAVDKTRRYQTMDEFRLALEQFL
ncbi:MAG: protein kinase domain-containing protein [Steroidobacteraceae bacterium]